MSMILLVVVGAINQSKYVPMMSLAVVGTLTNQILWVYSGFYVGVYAGLWGLCGGLHRSTWGSMHFYVGLCRGLHGSMQGSTWVYH